MLTSKRTNLKPLLESKDGVHLTAYLVNRGDLIDLKSQLQATIQEAYEWLDGAMSAEERQKFLEPLDNLLHDSRIFKQMNGNIGIFRNADLFRVLNIPIEVRQSCQVATSFHVKPLLRWLQNDQEFLLLGIERQSAHLYLGGQDSFKLVDSILFPQSFTLREHPTLHSSHQNAIMETETFSWLNDWILELTRKTEPKLFVAGEPSLVQALNRNLSYKNAVRAPIANAFNKHNPAALCQSIRNVLKDEAKKSLEKALLEFHLAEVENRAKKNIFQISRAVVRGKVRKLVVTDELSIFGKIDEKSGGIAIHPFDLDHEDDCLLDDLAQMVLSQGGEVVVAKKDEIPKGRPILAILANDDETLSKEESLQNEALQERFG